MPKQVKARAAQDEKEERMVRELARNPHAPAESVNYARMVVESWAGKSPNEIATKLACSSQMVCTRLEIFNANKGIKGLGTSELEGFLDNLATSELEGFLDILAKKQDDETKQKEYKAYKISPDLPTLASLERMLGSFLNPVLFQIPDRNESTQGLKQAYQLMLKDNTTPAKLRGAIGFICFTLELMDAAEKQNQDLDSPKKLLKDFAVLDWFKEVYAPSEQNLTWEWLDFNKLEVHRVGTTSFILKCQTKKEIHKLDEKDLVLKCLLYPYTRIDAITEATRGYALQYPVAKEPETIHVVPHVYASTDKWILMDLILGDTLQEFLQKRRKSEETTKTPLLLRTDLLSSIGKPLLKALETLSLFNPPLQHEDLTPSNIIVRTKQDGTTIEGITFIDLGRNYLYTGHLGLETRPDARFVAPEVKSGGSTGRADLYSFGMLLIELSDPIGVQGDTIPDSLYQYAPYLARFIEDLIDKKPENRLLIFPLASGKDRYPQLCSTLEKLLKVLPPESEVKPGKFFWVQQFIAIFYPRRQLSHAWMLWRIMHPDFQWRKFWRVLRPFPAQPAIAEYTGRLYGWLVISVISWWLIFVVCIVWGARDFGLNPFVPFYISIPQNLLPGCGGLCVPFIDGLRAQGYGFVITNMQARLVGFSSGLAQSVYYANILAGLTTRPMRRSTLARVTEVFMRAMTFTVLPLVLIGNLYQPALWPEMLFIGLTIPALSNILCYQLATRTLKKAWGVLSTVPLYDSSLKNFGQWGTTLFCYIIVVFFISIGLHNNILHDSWAWAIGAVVINVFIFCLSKGIILAPGARGSLCRAFTLGERLEAVAPQVPSPPRRLDKSIQHLSRSGDDN